MDWLIEALRVVREVRDWTNTRANRNPLAKRSHRALQKAVEATERAVDGASTLNSKKTNGRIEIERLGPAKLPARPTPPPKKAPGQTPHQEINLDLIDPHALTTVRRLRRFGHKAYLVGGCVRDLLLGLTPKDFDIATNARPEEIKSIFRNSRIIGRRFRLVHLYFRGGKIFEVSTFRAQVEADDESPDQDLLIRRDNIFGSEEEDARRRDFTINGLFYDIGSGKIIDHVGGLPDIKARYLRMIGDPDIRLREDPVRVLRAIRFVAKVDLKPDPALWASIASHRDELTRCAPARILEETLRLLRIGHAERTVRLMDETGVLQVLLPEIHEYLKLGDQPQELLYSHLRALDGLIRRGHVSDAVVLGALVAGPVHALLEDQDGAQTDRNRLLADFLAKFGQRITLTRRLSEHLRQIFIAQRHLAPGDKTRKRRRRISPSALVRRAFFQDALNLYEIRTRAMELPLKDVALWHQRAQQIAGLRLEPPFVDPEHANGDQAQAPAREGSNGKAAAPRRKRRRSRRRSSGA